MRIDLLVRYVGMGLIALMLVAAVLLAGYLLVMMRKNPGASGKGKTGAGSADRTDYQDTEDLLPFETIRDDMIVMKGRKRFVAAIRCYGFDFYTASTEEQIRCKNNYRMFIRNLPSKTTYRMYGEDVNMSHTYERYEKAYAEQEKITFNTNEDLRQLFSEIQRKRSRGEEIPEELARAVESMRKKVRVGQWRMEHLKSQMQLIGRVSGPSAAHQHIVQTYLTEWRADSIAEFGTVSDSELWQKAVRELDEQCRALITRLSSCGVVASRCRTGELVDMCHRHYHPVTGNSFTYKNLERSAADDFVVTTDSLKKMDEAFEDETVARLRGGR